MTPVLVGVAVAAVVVALIGLVAWMVRRLRRLAAAHRRESAGRGSAESQAADVDRRDWIYGERRPRQAPAPAAVEPETVEPEADSEASAAEFEQEQTPSVDETRRQAEIEPAATIEAAAGAATKIVVEAEETAQRLLGGAKRLAELEAKAIVETAEQEAWEVLVSTPPEPARNPETEQAGLTADEILANAREKANEIIAEAAAVESRIEREIVRAGAALLEERAKLAVFIGELLEEVRDASPFETDVLDLGKVRERKRGASTE